MPRCHALDKHVGDTYADRARQGPSHRFEDGGVGICNGRRFVSSHELPAGLQQSMGDDGANRSDRSRVELPEQFLRYGHGSALSSPEIHAAEIQLRDRILVPD
jgi:hypothetical protein